MRLFDPDLQPDDDCSDASRSEGRDAAGGASGASLLVAAVTAAADDLLDPVEELRLAFAEHGRVVEGLGRSTVSNRDLYLRGWLDHLAGTGVEVTEAGTADVLAFLTAEADRGIATATRSAQLLAIGALHRWLRLTGVSQTDPTADVPRPRVTREPVEVYRPDELAAMLSHTASLVDLDGRQRHAIVSFLRWTGVRSAEARTLTVNRLDLEAGRAVVLGKFNRERAIVLPPPLVAVLRVWLSEHRPRLPDGPLLFVNPRGYRDDQQYEQAAFGREVHAAATGAGIPGRHYPHRLRHTYATELLRAGVDLHVVQRLMGHRSVRTTVQYTHLSTDDLVDAVTAVWT